MGGRSQGLSRAGRRWKGIAQDPGRRGRRMGQPGTGSWAGEAPGSGRELRGREVGADFEVLCLWGWGVRCE